MLLLTPCPFELQLTVTVPVPGWASESTIHVHETLPAVSAVCFFESPGANDAFPPLNFAFTLHDALGAVTAVNVTLSLAATDAGRLVMSRAGAAGSGVSTGSEVSIGAGVAAAGVFAAGVFAAGVFVAGVFVAGLFVGVPPAGPGVVDGFVGPAGVEPAPEAPEAPEAPAIVGTAEVAPSVPGFRTLADPEPAAAPTRMAVGDPPGPPPELIVP